MQASNPNIGILVLDAGPFIDRKSLRGLAKRYVTTEQVVKELKDAKTRLHLEHLSLLQDVKIERLSLKAIYMSKAIAFAKKTGDYAVLSPPDLGILALALELKETSSDANLSLFCGDDPVEVKSQMPKVAEESDQLVHESENIQSALIKGLGPVAHSSQTLDSDSPLNDLTGIGEALLHRKNHADSLTSDNSFPASPSCGDATGIQTLYSDPSSEEDGEGDWITPQNVKSHRDQIKSSTSVPAPPNAQKFMPVACMTTDFALQNCLLQAGVDLVSYEGKKVSRVKTSVLRCHACFKICKDQSKKFCPSCGGPTLNRTSVTLVAPGVDSSTAEPELRVHLKRNYQWKLRGANADLPPPRMGKAAGGGITAPILREDQKEWQRGLRSEATRLRKEDRRVERVLAEKEKRGEEIWTDPEWIPQLLAGGKNLPQIGVPRRSGKLGKGR